MGGGGSARSNDAVDLALFANCNSNIQWMGDLVIMTHTQAFVQTKLMV